MGDLITTEFNLIGWTDQSSIRWDVVETVTVFTDMTLSAMLFLLQVNLLL